MPRPHTKSRTSFTRPGSVTYDLPSPPYSSPVVTITLPQNSTWTSGLHWHETHTEYLQVISGIALVTLSGITKSYSSSDGTITVPRHARHEWRRATAEGEELVMNEWTDPADGQKEKFFRNLSSVIEHNTKYGKPVEWWLMWQLFVVFWGLDNWPVLVGFERVPVVGHLLEWIVTHTILLVSVVLGKLLGLKSVYDEYTPRKPGAAGRDHEKKK